MIESSCYDYFGIGDGLSKTICPPGNASHCFDLNNRGHVDWPLITVWNKDHHYRLTTGGESGRLGVPQPVALNETEKQMCAILGLNELELGIFLREWTPLFYGEKRPETIDQVRRKLTQAK